MKRSLLLWDIDGTLLLTNGAGMRGMARASRKIYGDTFRWDGVHASGRLDPLIFADALARNGLAADEEDHRRFHDTYIVELEAGFQRHVSKPVEPDVLVGQVAALAGRQGPRRRASD